MMYTRTKGPWKWGHVKGDERTDGSDWGGLGLWTDDNKMILGSGDGWDGGFEPPENDGDKWLICASPDMYDAIVAFLRKVRQDHPEDFKGKGTGYTCPYVRDLLHAVVKAGWDGE